MTDAGTTQDNFILPALPVGGMRKMKHRYIYTMFINHTVYSVAAGCDKFKTDFENFCEGRKENVLINDTLNTFYLRLYGVGHGKGPFR